MRILLVSAVLGKPVGTQVHFRDHAAAFLRLGHSVMAYAPQLEAGASAIMADGGTLCSDLSALPTTPDVIMGYEHLPLMQALLHFREAPGIFYCHHWKHWSCRAPVFPRVRRYLAVDLNCRERVLRDAGLAEKDVEIVPNTLDLDRFPPRGNLPPRPTRAVVFSNYFLPDNEFLPVIRSACDRLGMTLDVVGTGMGTATADPGPTLGDYDIVFAKARCALEALAVGSHVVLCERGGRLGPTITEANLAGLLRWNLGERLLAGKATVEDLVARARAYDPQRSLNLRERVRAECGVAGSVSRLLGIFAEVVAGAPAAPPPAEEFAALGRYLSMLTPRGDVAAGHEPAPARAHGSAEAGVRDGLRPVPAARDSGRNYGRSMVVARSGIAATSQTQASQEAAQILARGGSAADAAIAANAVLTVLEPMKNGPGGDLAVLYWDAAKGELVGLNASGAAPLALSLDFLARQGLRHMPESGIHSVTVPGAVQGWARMHGRFGRLPWAELFEAAIGFAEEGFPIAETIAGTWRLPGALARLREDPESARIFLSGGTPPKEGQLFRNPDLARTLRLIARNGPDAFYRGEIGEAILGKSRALGGCLTAGDLSDYSPEWVQPISVDYRGWRVHELPPNCQGLAALEMLNIMEAARAHGHGRLGPEEIHLRIEAMKLAYADLRRYNGDPRRAQVPVAALLAKEYARLRASEIDPQRANRGVLPGTPASGDTTCLAVVDRQGCMASWIQSLSADFGSGLTAPGTGFSLQNRGSGFSLQPGHPNALAGGKRPFHTIIPAFLERGDTRVGFGIMGGLTQPLAHAQFVSNIVDLGMNIQAALEAPRFTIRGIDANAVALEGRVPPGTIQQLERRGHAIAAVGPYSQEMGRGQAVMHDSVARINWGASDPRADGAAIPESTTCRPAV
jgi:gamma-glutamyltranspeptidase/glutathione hydrolase